MSTRRAGNPATVACADNASTYTNTIDWTQQTNSLVTYPLQYNATAIYKGQSFRLIFREGNVNIRDIDSRIAMQVTFFFFTCLLTSGIISISQAVQCRGSAKYKLTFKGQWTKADHPQGFPEGKRPHFSPIVGCSHNASYVMWRPGQPATKGVQNVAEFGRSHTIYVYIYISYYILYTGMYTVYIYIYIACSIKCIILYIVQTYVVYI